MKKYLDYFILIIYVSLLCFISYYHEPWHDEGQAWLIARDDSIWHLITYTAHLEGHPPLWHLILMPWAKLGVAFPLGLKLVNIVCAGGAMWLLIYKSPLPWFLRYILPFSYYCFYQYGILNRSYSLLMFGLMLAAYYYPLRQNKPYHLIVSLAITSGAQAYGMMVAIGIAAAWLWEVLHSLGKRTFSWTALVNVWKVNRQIRALVCLFLIVFLLGLSMLPRHDTYFVGGDIPEHFGSSFLYSLIITPQQMLFSHDFKDNIMRQAIPFFTENVQTYWQMHHNFGFYAVIFLLGYILSYLYGFFIQLFMLYLAYKSRNLLLYLLPVLAYSTLASLVYWGFYHEGVLYCFFIFYIWIFFANPEKVYAIINEFKHKFTNVWEFRLIKLIMIGILAYIFYVNISWSFVASYNDYRLTYDASGEIASFMKENNLQTTNFWVSASTNEDNKFISSSPYNINAYFLKNVIANLDDCQTQVAYHEYKKFRTDEIIPIYQQLGYPDFLLTPAESKLKLLDYVFVKRPSYVLIKSFTGHKIWKKSYTNVNIYLYMRADLTSIYPQFNVLKISEKE